MIDRSKIEYCQDCFYKDKPVRGDEMCQLTPAECRVLETKEVINAKDRQ